MGDLEQPAASLTLGLGSAVSPPAQDLGLSDQEEIQFSHTATATQPQSHSNTATVIGCHTDTQSQQHRHTVTTNSHRHRATQSQTGTGTEQHKNTTSLDIFTSTVESFKMTKDEMSSSSNIIAITTSEIKTKMVDVSIEFTLIAKIR